MKYFLKRIILKIIEIVEYFEYKNKNYDSSTNNKIINTIKINYDLECDNTFENANYIHITKPYTIYKISTKTKTLNCADTHILFDENFNEIFTKDLKIHSKIQTKFGIEEVLKIQKLNTKLSMFDMSIDSNNHRYYTNDILSHNTITSSFFIMWFMCFHYDKNCLIVANKGSTVKEIIDKIKQVYENLPFFLKPGILINNVLSMKFDNGSRFIGQNTSKTPGLGFTIHLLYADEFAHIPPNIINHFYRSVFPTMSSSKLSRIIITSTANGMNKFFEIYKSALQGENDYAPIRVDWDAVPGRDEEWRNREISNLGSEEEFRQEYENQFFSDSQMALDRNTMKKLEKLSTKFEWRHMAEFEDEGVNYNNLIWNPKFSIYDITPFDRFVLSVDIASGGGQDFSVINIFKIEETSIAKIRTMKRFDDESNFFRLRQVGVFRDNKISVNDLAKILSVLTFDIFGEENVKIILEMNHKGELIVNYMENNPNYFAEIFVHTKHSMQAEHLNLGIRLNKNNKPLYCSEMSHLIRDNRLVISEKNSVLEALNFGIEPNGTFKSQLGNDDIIMTCANAVVFYKSLDFYEIIADLIDTIDPDKRYLIYNRLDNREETEIKIDYSLIANM